MELSFVTIKTKLANFLHRFHVILFTVVVLGGLAGVVYMLNDVIIQSESDTPSSAATQTSFDQETMKRIETLETPSGPPPKIDANGKRVNPFVE